VGGGVDAWVLRADLALVAEEGVVAFEAVEGWAGLCLEVCGAALGGAWLAGGPAAAVFNALAGCCRTGA